MRWTSVGLLFLSLGCSPDRVSVGLAGRELAGSHQGFRVQTIMPVYELRAKQRLADKVDLATRLQLNRGEVSAEHPIFRGGATGNFFGGGIGLDYYPLGTKKLGFEFGLEAFRSNYRMQGSYGPLYSTESDRFYGFGTNLGLTGELPLDREGRLSLVWGAGYNFTASQARHSRVNLDGCSGQLGIQISLGQISLDK